jgi:hypothetical protein
VRVHRAEDGTVLCTVHDGLASLADVLVGQAPDERTAFRLARRALVEHPAGVVVFTLPDNGIVVSTRDGVTFTVRSGRSATDRLALALHAMWSSR